MNPYLIAVIQGIVEGLTEFLPVSSTGHLILTGHLLGFEDEKAKAFEVVIQLGAILAVVWLYRAKIVELLRDRWREMPWSANQLTPWHIFLAMIPAGVVGLMFHKKIKAALFFPGPVCAALVVGGIFLILAERFQPAVRAEKLDQVTWRQALGIGMFQCLALWPGFSRAGATIAGGLLVGVSHYAAAEFSFLLAIPMMVAASGKDLFEVIGLLTPQDVGVFATGFVVSALVAWVAVVGFLRFLNRTKLTPFAWYRFVLAAAVAWGMLR